MKTKTESIIEWIKSLECIGCFSFVAVTTKDSLKKSRITGEATPERFKSIITYRYQTISCGNDYEKAVNNRLEKEGSNRDFSAVGTYCVPVGSGKILFKHKDKEQYYVRVYPNLCASFKTIVKRLDACGNDITDQWKAIEAEYFSIHKANDNQGLDNPIIVNNYKLENVKYLKRGEFELNELTGGILETLGLR